MYTVHVLELTGKIVEKLGLLQKEMFDWKLHRVIGCRFVTKRHYKAKIVFAKGIVKEYCDDKLYTSFGWGKVLYRETKSLASDVASTATLLAKLLDDAEFIIIEHRSGDFGHLTWLYPKNGEAILEIVPLVLPEPAWYTCEDVLMSKQLEEQLPH